MGNNVLINFSSHHLGAIPLKTTDNIFIPLVSADTIKAEPGLLVALKIAVCCKLKHPSVHCFFTVCLLKSEQSDKYLAQVCKPLGSLCPCCLSYGLKVN